MSAPTPIKVATYRSLTSEEKATIAFLASLLEFTTFYAVFTVPEP
jgi:hypothetical protein